MAVVQHLVAAGSATHHRNPLDLFPSLVQMDDFVPVEGDDAAIGQPSRRGDPSDHGSQHLFAATVHLDEQVITGDEGVAIGQTLDANGRDSFQFPQHRAAQVPFGDAVRLGHKDVLVGKNLGIRRPLKSGQGPALLCRQGPAR